MSNVKLPLILFLLFVCSHCFAQQAEGKQLDDDRWNWYVEALGGVQMSGIKNEDFVGSNYTPLINIIAGKWIVPYLALQAGYKGHYFNYIEDTFEHRYNFYYGEALLNLHKLLQRQGRYWNVMLHAGGGYFYNYYYGKGNICANMGIKQSFRITKQWQVTFDISSVIGWDIYQGDEDILPGAAIGIMYLF